MTTRRTFTAIAMATVAAALLTAAPMTVVQAGSDAKMHCFVLTSVRAITIAKRQRTSVKAMSLSPSLNMPAMRVAEEDPPLYAASLLSTVSFA